MTENFQHQQPFAPLPPMPPAAKKNWFARHKVMTGFGALVVVMAIGAAASGGSGDKTSTVDSASDTKPATSTAKTETKTDTKSEAKAETKADTKTAPAQDAKPAETVAEVVDGLQPDGKSWIYGDWKVSNVKVSKTSGLDWFDIAADVKYLGEDTSGGDKCFDLTLDKGDRQVASSTGCADGIQPGKTASVDFVTTEDFVSGPYDITVSKTW